MTLQSLKHEALKNKDVKQEYDRLESEFTLIEQLISMRKFNSTIRILVINL